MRGGGEGRAWVIAPVKGCQEGGKAIGPQKSGGRLDTLCVLTYPLSGLQLSIYKMQWISKGSSMKAQSWFSGDPFQKAVPIHTDFENSVLVKYVLRSGLKYPWPG